MIYILLLLLIALDILFFIFFDRNILSPSVLGTSMFVLSTFVAVLNVDYWKFTIQPFTVIIILTSLMTFGLGEFIVRLTFYKRNQFKPLSENEKSEAIQINNYFVLMIAILMTLLCVYYLSELLRLATLAGYKKNQGLLFVAYVREASLHPELYGRINRVAGWSSTFAMIFCFIFSYIVLYNKILFKKINLIYFVPIITYLPYTIFSGGRTFFIRIIAFCIVVGGCFYLQKHNWKFKYVLKVLKSGVFGILIFLVIFILVGALKSSEFIESAWSSISFYTGLSIPSLDDYFLHPRPKDVLFGENTLFGIYNTLRKFNPNIPLLYAPYDFVSFNGTSGNVYTIIRRYHEDFGFLGLYTLMFFLGLFYSLFFLKVNNKRKAGLLFYGFIISPIVEMSIEERFFMDIIGISTFAILILLYIFFLLFCDKKFRKSLSNLFFTRMQND